MDARCPKSAPGLEFCEARIGFCCLGLRFPGWGSGFSFRCSGFRASWFPKVLRFTGSKGMKGSRALDLGLRSPGFPGFQELGWLELKD